jgi:hypothetical protein
VEIGTKVKYYPIKGRDKHLVTEVLSEPWNVCGEMCCMIEGVRGGVSVDHLEILTTQTED